MWDQAVIQKLLSAQNTWVTGGPKYIDMQPIATEADLALHGMVRHSRGITQTSLSSSEAKLKNQTITSQAEGKFISDKSVGSKVESDSGSDVLEMRVFCDKVYATQAGVSLHITALTFKAGANLEDRWAATSYYRGKLKVEQGTRDDMTVLHIPTVMYFGDVLLLVLEETAGRGTLNY
ncbi:hypothetical protein BDR04DRAFT_1144987 [Suillus decipiens]|nr:hypothetical protein BDR04DRAFT_1144987 [Suillus decipiens]